MKGSKDSRRHVAEIRKAWPFAEAPLRRVVVKIGSNVLALKDGGVDKKRVTSLVNSIAAIYGQGLEVIVVSSGAVAAGRGLLGLSKRPTSIPALQAVAAIGQGALMEEYSQRFRRHDIIVAQMLLNRDDMDDRRRYLNARFALTELLHRRVVPIINENDSVTIDELKFGDNDMLSAMVAAKMDADLLIILSNVPGLMTGHPNKDPKAELIPVVSRLNEEHIGLVDAAASDHGTGGMKTKLLAARHAAQFGVACAVVDGMREGKIERVVAGEFEGTLFLPTSMRRSGMSRRHWLSSVRPKGEIVVDAGARRAILKNGKSLLAVGVRATTGDYIKGDVVSISDKNGVEIARGVVNFDAADVEQIKGVKGAELGRVLGTVSYSEVVHRNNMVLVEEFDA